MYVYVFLRFDFALLTFAFVLQRGDQSCQLTDRKPAVLEVRVADRSFSRPTISVQAPSHSTPTLPHSFSLLLIKSLEILSVETSLSVTFCIAHLQTTHLSDPEVRIPCFYRCLSVGVACVLVEEVRRQFFPKWNFIILLQSLRRFINHSKFLLVEAPILKEYNKVLPKYAVTDLPQSIDLQALLASLMLVRMEYRSSVA